MSIFIIVCVFVIIVYFLLTSDSRSLEKQIQAGFPDSWEEILKSHVGIFHVLTPEMQKRFKERVHRFIITTPIVGFQTDVDDVLKILVASSAVMLTLSFEKWNFSYLRGVIVTDQRISNNHEAGNSVLGQVETDGDSSKIVLSKACLLQGFKNMADRNNVGVHEFAHVLDHADGKIDGIPRVIMPPDLVDKWVQLTGKKIADIYKGRSDINEYGATSESEFFAVATEYFFEKPDIMQKNHPEMYILLSKTFQQDSSSAFKVDFRKLIGLTKDSVGRNSPCPCGSGKKFKKCCLR
jgi:Mlc titration factor MtfA (ptsG expression regulator)